MQAALEMLAAGRYAEAESAALTVAGGPGDLAPRAWAVVGAARQRLGRYAEAVQAYRAFLATCDSAPVRRYIHSQIRFCQSVGRPAPVAPGKRLDEARRKELAAVDAQTYAESTEHFIVRARNAALAKLTAEEAENALRRICRVILAGQEYPHAVEINVWPDASEYRANARDAPEWSGGSFTFSDRDDVTTRRIDLTQLDARGAFNAVMLDRVLPHEMCHLVTREYFGDAPSPLFLMEGLGMLAEAEVDNDRIILAGAALASRSKIPLDSLLLCQLHDLGQPAVFYAEAFSLVSFIHSRLNESQFRDFLEHMKNGASVADSLQRALGSPPEDVFLPKLASAWEDNAIAQGQFLRALQVQSRLTAAATE